MPYKDPKKQRAAMRVISRRHRAKQKQKLKQLQSQFPDIYTLVFGKQRSSRKK